MSARSERDVLVAHHVLEFPGGYKRSLGPVVSRFLTGLRDRQLWGAPTAEGRVLVPPTEYDPETAEPVGDDWVEVGPAGTVTTWTWVAKPRPQHPLDHPFAWALVRLDGADTAMLHAVDAGRADAMRTGMRVRPRWRAETVGNVLDIECFEPDAREASPSEPSADDRAPANRASPSAGGELSTMESPIRIEYDIGAGTAQSRFLNGLIEGKIRGQRCPVCGKVYLPPRGSCPVDGVATEEEVEVSETGTVTTFCVVNIAFSDKAPAVPYVCAQVLLDGADTALFGLVADMPAEECRMGLRVEAVWVPPEERRPSTECIKWFRPTGDADAPFESYQDYL